ncbi:hypothetical protein ACQEU3_17955 [Spirillospora sp. CA-253888]
MRHLLSLATTVTLASAVLAVPATAHAEVHMTRMNVHFDNLAPDRVATIAVGARSEAGIKEIRAELRHPGSAKAPYATLTDFTRTAGTDENGVWQIAYRPDIEIRPGFNHVTVTVTDGDGNATSYSSNFQDCYATAFAGFTAQPAVLDADHRTATVRGRLVFRKSRAEEPRPVPSARVTSSRARSQAVTGADGGFTLTAQPDDAGADFRAAGALCSWSERAPFTVKRQATQVKAQLAAPQPAPPGEAATLNGKVMRQAATGMVPAGGADVSLRFEARSGVLKEWTVRAGADGSFTTRLPRENGRWIVRARESVFYAQSAEAAGEVVIGRYATQITGSDAGPEPVVKQDDVTVTGTLRRTGGGPLANALLRVEFSADGKTGWRDQGDARSDRNGKVRARVRIVETAGYWRLAFSGDDQNAPSAGWADHVEVRDRTRIDDFNASPEPVRKGRTVTVQGDLRRLTRTSTSGLGGQKVSFYFLPKGAKKWTYLAASTTGRLGHFTHHFKAVKDGTWRVYYGGTAVYAKTYRDDYVDVR